MGDSVRLLRFLAVIEGISLLILFFIAMPLKYMYGMPEAVSVFGWIHGLLFMAFVFYATKVSQQQGWTEGFLFMLVLSSMVPFGMLFMDPRLRAKAVVAN